MLRVPLVAHQCFHSLPLPSSSSHHLLNGNVVSWVETLLSSLEGLRWQGWGRIWAPKST